MGAGIYRSLVVVVFAAVLAGWCAVAPAAVQNLPGAAAVAVSGAGTGMVPRGALPVVLDAISPGLPEHYGWQSLSRSAEAGAPGFAAVNDRHHHVYRLVDGALELSLSGTREAGHALRLRLSEYGRPGELRPVGAVLDTGFPHANQLRQQYAGDIEEWFVNAPVGLEHGFTLTRPPAGDPDQPLVLALEVSGDLAPSVDADGLGVAFLDAQGRVLFGYRGLTAFDSSGRLLPVALSIADDRLRLQVDAQDAVYPVTVDPLFATEQVHYANDTPVEDDQFGYSVAIDGDWMAVGAPYDNQRGADAGAVYLFARTGPEIKGLGWSLYGKLAPSVLQAGDNFGASVAINGNVLVIGAYGDDNAAGTDAGAAYIYEHEGLYWNYKTSITGSALAAGHWFGYSTAVYGSTVIVSAPQSFSAVNGTGDVYKFTYSTSTNTATEESRLYPSAGVGGRSGDHFGFSVSYAGYYLVVGSPYDDDAGTNAGAVYVYYPSGLGWNQDEKITLGTSAADYDYFGRAVDVDGPLLVAAAPYSDLHASNAGAAFVYWRANTSPYDWVQIASLLPKQDDNVTSDIGAGDYFGSAVDIERNSNGYGIDYVLVGSPYNDDAGTNSGSAYLFEGSGWNQVRKFTAATAYSLEEFGKAVAIDDQSAVIGVPKADGGLNYGRVHTFGTRAQSILDLEVSSHSIQANSTLSITAQLRVGGVPAGSPDLSGRPIEMVVRDPSGALAWYGGGYTDSNGRVSVSGVNVFTQNGTYTVQAGFDNASLPLATWTSATSEIENVVVNAHAGWAVIIEGGLAAPDTLGEDSHNKSAGRIYQTLLDRGFTADRIFYFNQVTGDPARPGVDATPTIANLNARLITDADSLLNGVAAAPGPVHFFPLDHGAPGGRFFLNPGTGGLPEEMTPALLDGWIDSIEALPAMSDWPVTVNLAACYSGGFLPGLSDPASPRRVLITSAREDEEAFKGPQEQDAPRSGSFFLDELLVELERGRSFRDSFGDAAQRTLVYTRADDSGLAAANQYADHALQHPQLDDNGDDLGSTLLSEGTTGGVPADGSFAADVYLGFGSTDNSVTHVVDEVIYLNGPQTETLVLNPNGHSSGATIAVRGPGTDLTSVLSGGSGTEQLVAPYDFGPMTYLGSPLFLYAVDVPFLLQGRWDVWYFLEDDPDNTTELGKYTAVKHSIVYVSDGGQVPGSFSLLQPVNGEPHAKTQQRFDWTQSTDPDGDAVTYELLISTSSATNGNGHLNSPAVRITSIPSSQFYVDRSYGLQDVTLYYWQVLAVDASGNVRASTIRNFTTDDTNFVGGPLVGQVRKAGVTSALSGAVVTLSPSGFAAPSDEGGNYVVEGAPPGPATATASLSGYLDRAADVALSYDGSPTRQDYELVGYSDSDGDGIPDADDNCPNDANQNQWDFDGDTLGNACDSDDDDDGLSDAQEAAAGTYPLDPDSDNDTVLDGADAFPLDPTEQLDTDGDGNGDNADPDADNDGVPDSTDTDWLDPQVCSDTDADLCDDCARGVDGFGPLPDNTPGNDGDDYDADGLCDLSDPPPVADGDLNGDGSVDVRDVVLGLRILLGYIDINSSPDYLFHGDVAPPGPPPGNGIFDLGDVLLIREMVHAQ